MTFAEARGDDSSAIVDSHLVHAFPVRTDLPLVRPERPDWNPSLSLQTVRVEAHRLCYAVKGAGEPIVLIHGYGAGMWVGKADGCPCQRLSGLAIDLPAMVF